jgi:hypothetical protein
MAFGLPAAAGDRPGSPAGLFFTVVVLFALQGKAITSQPLDVAQIALPPLAYFALMWTGSFLAGRWLHLTYGRTAALAFSAASNDFELAIAVAIGVFGATSGQAPGQGLAGVVGPLIAVPVCSPWSTSRCGHAAVTGRPRRNKRELLRLRRPRRYRPRRRHLRRLRRRGLRRPRPGQPALAGPRDGPRQVRGRRAAR